MKGAVNVIGIANSDRTILAVPMQKVYEVLIVRLLLFFSIDLVKL